MRAVGVGFTSIVLAVACATIPADAPRYSRAPDPGAGKTNLYVYRSRLEAGCQKLTAPTLYVDGHPIFNLVENAYTVIPLAPATHRLKVWWGNGNCPDLEFYVTIEASGSQYIKFSDTFGPKWTPQGPGWLGVARAAQIAEATAETELRACCRFLPADALPANLSPEDALIRGR